MDPALAQLHAAATVVHESDEQRSPTVPKPKSIPPNVCIFDNHVSTDANAYVRIVVAHSRSVCPSIAVYVFGCLQRSD